MSNQDTDDTIAQVNSLLDREQYPQAIKVLNVAIQQYPDNAEFHFLRARANVGWAANIEALRDFEQAIAIEPDQVRYHLTLGHFHLAQQRYDDAATAFARAQHLAPNDVEVRLAFLEIQTIRGEFDDVIPALEKLHGESPGNEKIANVLAIAYYEKGIQNWHREDSDQGVMICAMNADDIAVGSEYLEKINALSPRTDTVNDQSADLADIIALGKKRRFQGGWFSWVVPLILLLVGASVGGFGGSVYAVSAFAFFFAFWRPTYVSNYLYYTNRDDFSAADRIMSFIDGNWMVFAPSITGVITQQLKIAAYMQILRAAIIGIFLPFSVFSAFRQNYSMKHAASFAAAAIAVGLLASYSGGSPTVSRPAIVNTERPAPAVPQQGGTQSTAGTNSPQMGRIPLRNASFEEDSLGAEGWQFGVAGWTGTRHGVMLPSETVFRGGVAPEGGQLAFLSQAGSSMMQVLPIELLGGWEYTFQVFAGLRLDTGFDPGRFELQLLSGSTVLNQLSAETPDKGEFVASELVFNAPDAVQNTGPLAIRLVNTSGRQINFDDVRIYAWPATAGERPPGLTFSNTMLSPAPAPAPVPVADEAVPGDGPVAPAPEQARVEQPSVESQPATAAPVATTTAPAAASVGNGAATAMSEYWHMRIVPISEEVPVDPGIRAFWDKGVYVFFREDGNIGFNTDMPGPYFYQGSKTWQQAGQQLNINLDGMPYELVLPDAGSQTISTVDSGPGMFRMLLEPKESGQQ